MPSIVKRIRDIFGISGQENVKQASIYIFIIFMLGIPVFKYQYFIFSFFRIMGLSILIFLAFIKGNITGNEQKNEIIKFNWGACIGTWIWGLLNKSYKTLWAIPLCLTTGAFPFCIVCGLKGNEWAYKKYKNKDIEQFNSHQQVQTMIIAIIIPIISVITFMIGSITLYNFMAKNANTYPDFTQKAVEYYINMESKAAVSRFDKIEIDINEYKFYINPQKWQTSTYKQKIADFDMAMGYVIQNNKDKDNIVQRFSSSSIMNIMNKIKIYSTYNNELLGEFHVDTETINKLFKELNNNPAYQKNILEEIKKGYKFNIHPSLP